MQKSISLTTAMVEDLVLLRRLFAEAGYFTFTPHEIYERSVFDFVAVNKVSGRDPIMVRPSVYLKGKAKVPTLRIETRKYHMSNSIEFLLKKFRPKLTHRVRQRHVLPLAPEGAYWLRFITEAEHEEFARLFPPSSYRW